MTSSLHVRHIQDEHNAKSLEPHWGYFARVKPCVNDNGTCAYLDLVYHMHDVSMLYTFIFWAVVGGILLLWLVIRLVTPTHESIKSHEPEGAVVKSKPTFLRRLFSSIAALERRWLLPETLPSKFGHVSGLQVTILAVLLGYLLIFSLVGVGYQTWITPIKGSTLHNTRTGIGPWGDRIGALAYALTPFTVALSTRESILSLITGVPYQHFNFLHRWTGRIIYIQSVLHTLAWTIVEGKLYQPQPKTFRNWIREQYMVFGCVALVFISFLYFFSLRSVIRLTGYEFFRKSHYIVALLYIAACWGHWTKLACWMIASFGLFGIDRGLRLIRSLLIHTGHKSGGKGIGFRSAEATVTLYGDVDAEVTRVDFKFDHSAWKVGQHYFLCFPALSVWQSHPMTPASVPVASSSSQQHTYIIRARKGMTKRLADLGRTTVDGNVATTSVILSGAYGESVVGNVKEVRNVMAIAGGTGITYALPIVDEALNRAQRLGTGSVQLVWVIRKTRNVEWIMPELVALRRHLSEKKVDLQIRLFVTRDSPPSSSNSLKSNQDCEKSPHAGKPHPTIETTSVESSEVADVISAMPGFSIEWLGDHHPNFGSAQGLGILEEWLDRASTNGGRNVVFGSGVAQMGRDLRIAVAAENNASKVWKGEQRYAVELHWDDRF